MRTGERKEKKSEFSQIYGTRESLKEERMTHAVAPRYESALQGSTEGISRHNISYNGEKHSIIHILLKKVLRYVEKAILSVKDFSRDHGQWK